MQLIRSILFSLILLTFSHPVLAACKPGYEQQQREIIRQHYQQQIAEVQRWRDDKISHALEMYQKEYYNDSKAIMEEWRQEKAELAEQITSDDSGRGMQKAYSDKARSIGKEYRQEIRILQKDHSGKYWSQISLIREEASSMRESLNKFKSEDIAQLNLEVSGNCKNLSKSKLRKTLEWMFEKIEDGKKQDEREIPGTLGTRG